jgi:glycosyltransferase involved in cell wall biosynthesis
MPNQITLLIPFFNEGHRIIKTLELLARVSEFDAIVCVDDGSNDEIHKKISQKFPHIQLLRLDSNQGKTTAISRALPLIKTPLVCLFDADLTNFSPNVLSKVILLMKKNPKVDGVIMRQKDDPMLAKMFRFDILVSGERILKTNDLKSVLQKNFVNYQLELAINEFWMRHGKIVVWFPFASQNKFKFQKWSLLVAFKKSWQFYQQLLQIQFMKQWLFFRPSPARKINLLFSEKLSANHNLLSLFCLGVKNYKTWLFCCIALYFSRIDQ